MTGVQTCALPIFNQYVTRVAEASEQRAAQSHRELRSISMFILLSALLALAITGCAGWYIYRNLGSNLTAISPVSYTHLDVYKRQILATCGSPLGRRISSPLNSLASSSLMVW